jgi:hypothetical protein
MKGQISYEFYFALSIFVIFTTYIIFQVMVASPNYVRQLQSQNTMLDAFRVSELLVDDNGYPVNWQSNPSLTRRLGLSDETRNVTNMLSAAKVNSFGSLCSSDYSRVKQLLGLGPSTQMIVSISNIATNSNMVACIPPQVVSKNTDIVSITRLAALNDGTYANITVTVW